MKEPIIVELNTGEFITLEYRKNLPYIRWIKDGVLVVDRPAYGAEEKLMLLMGPFE